MDTVQQLTDRQEITDVLIALGRWLDGRGGVPTAIFDPDVVVHSPRGDLQGVQDVTWARPFAPRRRACATVKEMIESPDDAGMSSSHRRSPVFGRRRPLLRDSRVFVAMRLLGAIVFMLTDHGLDVEDLGLLAGLVAIGAVASGAATFGRRSVRALAFEAALAMDIAVLAIIVHQTGGLASPLLPLVALWTVLAVIAHSSVGAALWCAGLALSVFGVGSLTRLLDLEVEPPPTGGRSVLVVSVLIVIAAAAASEQAALHLDAAERHLEALSLRDPLTGLWNRRAFDSRLEAAGASAQRGRPSTLVILDVDHFKQVNDQHGHPAGDRALTHLAQILLRSTRVDDECFRIGGEEFALLMPGATDHEAMAALERAREALASSPPDTGPLTFSAGVVAIRDTDHATHAFVLADRALYDAKAAGRNTDRTMDIPRYGDLTGYQSRDHVGPGVSG